MSVARILWNDLKIEFFTVWEYKFNLVMLFFLEIIYLGVAALSLLVVFSYVSDIKGLTFYDLIFYIIIADICIMVFDSLGIYLINYVVKGNINKFLVRPVNELLLMVEFNVSTMVYCILDFILLIVFCIVFPQQITLLNFLLMVINMIISLPLLLLPVLSIMSLSFWFGEVYMLVSAYRSIGQSFNRYPITILSKIFFTVFVAITPIGYFGWYLSLIILVGKVSYSWMLWMWLLIIVLDIVFWFIFRFIYKKGLRQYEGFG